MFNLVEETSKLRLENNLIKSGQIRDSWFSLGFNLISLVLVLGSFFFFLYYSYNPNPPAAPPNIEYKSVPWMNAVKNVPSGVQYGQLPQTETGGGVQGFEYRTSTSAF
jgi:hypothetical protein